MHPDRSHGTGAHRPQPDLLFRFSLARLVLSLLRRQPARALLRFGIARSGQGRRARGAVALRNPGRVPRRAHVGGLRGDRRDGKHEGQSHAHDFRHGRRAEALDVPVHRLENGKVGGGDDSGSQEVPGCLAGVSSDDALGDDEQRQADEELEVGGEVEKEVLAGCSPQAHVAHELGQQGCDAPRERHEDETATDQMDIASRVKPEPAESPVDEIAVEQRESYPRGWRWKPRPAWAGNEPFGALPAALAGTLTHDVALSLGDADTTAGSHSHATGLRGAALGRPRYPTRERREPT